MAIKMVRAILIDPIRETVTELEHNAADYREIYKALCDPENGLRVDDFNSVVLDRKHILWVDGEGLLKNPSHFILWRDYPQPLAGRGLILGSTRSGDSCAASLGLDYVKERVSFKRLSVQGFAERLYDTDHPVLGRAAVLERKAIFGPPKKEE